MPLKRIFPVFIFLFCSGWLVADGFNSISRSNASLKKAEKAMKERDFQTAVKSYEAALKEKTDLPSQVYLNLGNAFYELGKKEAARKNYQSVLSSSGPQPQKSIACLQLGNLAAREANYTEALEWYKKSLLFNPENQKARNNFELAWKLKKQEEEEEKKQKENQPDTQENQQQSEQEGGTGSDQDRKAAERGNNAEKQKQGEKKEKSQGKGSESEPKGKQGSEQKDAQQQERDKAGKDGEQENPDNGENKSKNKTTESNPEDLDSYRVDKNKLRETGLNEEQARNMLQAMRESEVKYLQQRRFKGKNSAEGKSGRRW